jgi:hypothetical protein
VLSKSAKSSHLPSRKTTDASALICGSRGGMFGWIGLV